MIRLIRLIRLMLVVRLTVRLVEPLINPYSQDLDRPSQNVRDPVRERAQANYAAVVKELNEKFKGLKEGCYPRPKGKLGEFAKQCHGQVLNLGHLICSLDPNRLRHFRLSVRRWTYGRGS